MWEGSEHQNFEESKEIIKPLTEEEKKAKLAELKQRFFSHERKMMDERFNAVRLAEKRATQAIVDQQENKKNEAIRRKATQDTEKIKEEMRRKEQLKEVEKRKQEKIDDARAKARVLEKIKETQQARKEQAEKEKAAREGRAYEEVSKPVEVPKKTVNHSEARLQLRLPAGQPPLIKTFAAEATLFEVAAAIEEERGMCDVEGEG